MEPNHAPNGRLSEQDTQSPLFSHSSQSSLSSPLEPFINMSEDSSNSDDQMDNNSQSNTSKPKPPLSNQSIRQQRRAKKL